MTRNQQNHQRRLAKIRHSMTRATWAPRRRDDSDLSIFNNKLTSKGWKVD